MPVHLLSNESSVPRPTTRAGGMAEPSPAAGPSRRQFLAGLAAAGCAAVGGGATHVGPDVPAPAPAPGPPPALKARPKPEEGWYALLSDLHIASDPNHRVFHQNMTDHLKSVVNDILSEKERPQGVIISGDLAVWDGQADDYRALVGLLRPLRDADIPVHLALGNHDRRDHFREVVGGGSLLEDHQVCSVEGAGLRFVLLDTLDKVAQTPGLVGGSQLSWLAAELDAHPETPTVVVMHHNPNNLPWTQIRGVEDSESLIKLLVSRPQVKLVAFGHTHTFRVRNEMGLFLLNLPAVAYAFDRHSRLGYCRFRPRGESAEFSMRGIRGTVRPQGTLSLRWRHT